MVSLLKTKKRNFPGVKFRKKRKVDRMRKSIIAASLAVAALFAVTGCSSVQVANPGDFNGQELVSSGDAIGHVAATTHGVYFLKWPLITGSGDSIGMPCLLTDTVNPNYLAELVTREAKSMGGKEVIDLTTSSSGSGFLVKYKYASASATVVD